ncbi:glycosyltransferase family 2 protein [Pseudanabaena sp. FACHB-1998]|uniref:glycosyltransferase family 2 protein n=1 Tax=Pseudanabaena sp. FACHB-1998 TaxID=2692858 RepID=UPI001999C415|nr:glycosyltransferase [Pseudanabaena sp. FACHB-1998]MBD2176618.1 glycosyltransferase family 2 protein [Pseudanabaena sp. FACHB-1998]
MALCRVYLLTYRRNQLLQRALNSLLQQTFKDWVCEIHNDDPNDFFPKQLVENVSDNRLILISHPENLGAVKSFNLIFKEVSEPFISLLEDDNWWEPNFLETMIEAMHHYPNVQIAWSNMRIWQELPEGGWEDTGENIWNYQKNVDFKLFDWGQQQQIMGALHSNGSSIVRSHNASNYIVPDETEFAAIEPVRERAFLYPILLVTKVCANFAVTLQTSRQENRIAWSQMQVLLAASYFKNFTFEAEKAKKAWLEARSKKAKSTSVLFFVVLNCPDCLWILKYATLPDWLFFIAHSIKRPFLAIESAKAIKSYPLLWSFLDRQTALRLKETQMKIVIDTDECLE